MNYLLYILIGLAPSVIWLSFYLRKDRHPEPNRMIIKVFVWGMLIGPLAVVLEIIFRWLAYPMGIKEFADTLIYGLPENLSWVFTVSIVLIAPVVEEFLKYRVVKDKVLRNREFDEPLDAMLYLIISALGFAAIENIFLVFDPNLHLGEMISLISFRFVSATFVHALASGILGYWLARSIREPHKKFQMMAKGFALAIFFHSGYNYLTRILGISTASENNFLAAAALLMIFILIVIMAIVVSHKFSMLKKMLSTCLVSGPGIQVNSPDKKLRNSPVKSY